MKIFNYIFLEKDIRFGEDKVIYYKKIVATKLKKYAIGDKIVFTTKIIIDPENTIKEKCKVVGIVKKIINKNIIVVCLENI